MKLTEQQLRKMIKTIIKEMNGKERNVKAILRSLDVSSNLAKRSLDANGNLPENDLEALKDNLRGALIELDRIS
jgi:hypothetical protein